MAMVAVTGPLTWLHAPVPTLGVLPAMVALPGLLQMVWLEPALAVVGAGFAVTVISLVLAEQGALVMVQRNTYDPAVVIPVMLVLRAAGLAIEAVTGPLTWVHAPTPVVGLLAAMTALPLDTQMVCGGPALETVGEATAVTVMLSVVAVQMPVLLMVQRRT